MASPEGIVFGNGHHLPDATALAGFDRRAFIDNWVSGGTTAVSHVPGHPGAVVRIQSAWRETEDEYYSFIEQGVRHLTQLERADITVPPQRFVVAPGFEGRGKCLFTFTNFIEGRPLTYETSDSSLTAPVIAGIAQYMHWAYHHPGESHFLWDKIWPYQFTVRPDNSVILHDVGLDFQAIGKSERRPWHTDMYQSSVDLENWATEAHIKKPDSLHRLMRDIEPVPLRIVRKLINKILA